MEDVEPTTSLQVMRRVDGVFETSVKLLERSFDLRQRAKRLRGDPQQQLIKTSNDLLDQVQLSIDELAKIFAGVQKLSVQRLTGRGATEGDLRQNVQELHELLGAAERAEDRRQSMLTGEDPTKYAEYLKES